MSGRRTTHREKVGLGTTEETLVGTGPLPRELSVGVDSLAPRGPRPTAAGESSPVPTPPRPGVSYTT